MVKRPKFTLTFAPEAIDHLDLIHEDCPFSGREGAFERLSR